MNRCFTSPTSRATPAGRRHGSTWVALACLFGAASPSHADEHGARVPPLPAYQRECAACHVAYPSHLLPAASWARLMKQLPQHFGTDASLDDPATARQIGDWLAAHAATGRRAADVIEQDRITHSPWFLREHREMPAAVWQRAAIKSPANCAACHPGAAEGRFGEHEIRIPK